MSFVAPILGVQAIVILADEVFFHRRRFLPRWERVGHPIDTFSMLVCLLVPFLFAPHRGSLLAFGCLGVFSSLLVTKDEQVHSQHCHWKEHWLHSVLFLVHPVVLIAVGLAWASALEQDRFRSILLAQILLMGAFLAYQIIYWNWLWIKQK